MATITSTGPKIDQTEHIKQEHLRIVHDSVTKRVHLSYALKCKDEDCPLREQSVLFKICPSSPCPPTS